MIETKFGRCTIPLTYYLPTPPVLWKVVLFLREFPSLEPNEEEGYVTRDVQQHLTCTDCRPRAQSMAPTQQQYNETGSMNV